MEEKKETLFQKIKRKAKELVYGIVDKVLDLANWVIDNPELSAVLLAAGGWVLAFGKKLFGFARQHKKEAARLAEEAKRKFIVWDRSNNCYVILTRDLTDADLEAFQRRKEILGETLLEFAKNNNIYKGVTLTR